MFYEQHRIIAFGLRPFPVAPFQGARRRRWRCLHAVYFWGCGTTLSLRAAPLRSVDALSCKRCASWPWAGQPPPTPDARAMAMTQGRFFLGEGSVLRDKASLSASVIMLANPSAGTTLASPKL